MHQEIGYTNKIKSTTIKASIGWSKDKVYVSITNFVYHTTSIMLTLVLIFEGLFRDTHMDPSTKGQANKKLRGKVKKKLSYDLEVWGKGFEVDGEAYS